MTKIQLNDAKLRSLAAPPTGQKCFWDASLPSFGIRVSQGGTKTFVLNRDKSLVTIGRFGVLTLQEARTEARRLLAERVLGKVRPQSITYPTALQLFLDEKAKSRRANTVANHKDRLERHFPFKGQVGEITHHDVLRRLSKIGTNSEYDHALSCAKTFFTWCMNRRYIDDNPCRGISTRGAASRARVLTDKELKAIWDACSDNALPAHFRDIVKLLICTGLRRGEASSVQSNFLDGDTLTIPASLTKNNRQHSIPCGKLTKELLTHCPFSSNSWSKNKKLLDQLSGIYDWTLHDLRRTFATKMASLGVAPLVSQPASRWWDRQAA